MSQEVDYRDRQLVKGKEKNARYKVLMQLSSHYKSKES